MNGENFKAMQNKAANKSTCPESTSIQFMRRLIHKNCTAARFLCNQKYFQWTHYASSKNLPKVFEFNGGYNSRQGDVKIVNLMLELRYSNSILPFDFKTQKVYNCYTCAVTYFSVLSTSRQRQWERFSAVILGVYFHVQVRRTKVNDLKCRQGKARH